MYLIDSINPSVMELCDYLSSVPILTAALLVYVSEAAEIINHFLHQQ